MARFRILVAVALLTSAAAVGAAETVTFTYDVLGRLTAAATTGGPNGGLFQGYALDPANNRTSYTVTGSPNAGRPDAALLVLPLSDYTLLPVEIPE